MRRRYFKRIVNENRKHRRFVKESPFTHTDLKVYSYYSVEDLYELCKGVSQAINNLKLFTDDELEKILNGLAMDNEEIESGELIDIIRFEPEYLTNFIGWDSSEYDNIDDFWEAFENR